ncbi:hypothetical protein [Rhodococcus qingshengii]|uniref:hypothetical protein n=1 Tax=Rhodococcus qingshengii TaxID=334542 RepID=UPI001AE07BB6|nr:hypothetical protein [Rhodococcus qingshengii]
MSTPHRRTEPDPVIDWVWEDGQLHGRTADGTISVSANLQRAQWSWGAYTLFAEQLDDQVWLTFDKVVDEVGRLGVPHTSAVEVLGPWMGRAATPLRALNSALTKEKLSTLPPDAQVPSVAYAVVAQAVRIFENPQGGVPAVREIAAH